MRLSTCSIHIDNLIYQRIYQSCLVHADILFPQYELLLILLKKNHRKIENIYFKSTSIVASIVDLVETGETSLISSNWLIILMNTNTHAS